MSAAVVGMPKLDHIDENIAWARGFTPMPAKQMHDLSNALSTRHKARLDRYFADHIDA